MLTFQCVLGIETKKLVKLHNDITSIIYVRQSSLFLLENIWLIKVCKTVAISHLELRHGALQDISNDLLLGVVRIIKSWVL